MATAPYGYSQDLWDELSPEAKAVVERPESQRLGRAQDTRDFLGDDIQTFEKLGETGSSWGGKQITYQAYDAQGRPTEKFAVDESGLQKGLQIAAQMAASMIPMAGAGAAIGAAMGIPAQYAAHFGNALLSGGMSALSGGNFVKGAVAGGLGSYASPYISEFAKTAGQAVGGDTLGKIASGAVQGAGRSAIGATITGDSIGNALLSGAAGGAASAGTDLLVKGTNSTLGQYLKDVPAPIRNAVTSAATAGLLGKDIEKAAVNAFVGSLIKGVPSGTGTQKLADVTGADAIEGFFAPGGEGYVDPNAGNLPDWALDPYKDDTTTATFKLPTDEDYEELESILLRYPEQQERAAELKTSMSPQEMARFLEANIDDPGTIDTLMQEYFPELYRQSIDVTGTRETTPTPDYTQDLFPPIEPKSIRDVGPVTTISPGEKLEGTEIKEPDLAAGLKPATTGGTKTTTKTTTDKKNEIDWAKLFALLGSMQRPQERQEQYQLANMPDYEDLMYGLSSGETPYMRG